MHFKEGVSVLGLKPEITCIFPAIERVYDKLGKNAAITSGTEGKHSAYSRHYVGLAVDLRTYYFNKEEIGTAAYQLKRAIGEDYNVRVEKDHIHVSYKPTR